MSATVTQGDVFDVLPAIPPGSVDAICTSPPYWALRSYLPKDHPLKPRELGSERTPAEYVDNMVRVFRLVRDCLADHGTAWLNIGDTYSGDKVDAAPRASYGFTPKQATNPHSDCRLRDGPAPGIPAGSLCLIPQRLAIALADDGWLVRSVICWQKPSCMPQSLAGWMWRRCRVKTSPPRPRLGRDSKDNSNLTPFAGTGAFKDFVADWADCPGCARCEPHGGYVLRRGSWRPTSSYEPVLMLAKRSGYFADGIAVQTPTATATVGRNRYTRVLDDPDEQFAVRHDHESTGATANLRDVWRIAAEPLREAHYAAFPTALVTTCLKAATSQRGYCPHCGKPWCRVVEETENIHPGSSHDHSLDGITNRGRRADGKPQGSIMRERFEAGHGPVTLGWRPTCSCPPHDPRAGRVLDPFAGSGRTGVACLRMGLDFTGVELNPDYAAMARRLLREESPLFAGVDAP